MSKPLQSPRRCDNHARQVGGTRVESSVPGTEILIFRNRRRESLSGPADAFLGKSLVARADRARDEQRFVDAAVLYEEALRLGVSKPGIHVQAAHMYKEHGDLEAAERHYLIASGALPDDADLALQMGHFYKRAGRLQEAERAYRRAMRLKPDWPVPADELARFQEWGWQPSEGEAPLTSLAGLEADADTLRRAANFATSIPEIAPLPLQETLHDHGESIHLRRFGHPERSPWGIQPTFRGVEAIRGFCLAREPIVEVQILLNEQLIDRSVPKSYKLRNERTDAAMRKYVFNAWLDFANFRAGRYLLEIRCRDVNGSRGSVADARLYRQHIVIAHPRSEPAFHGSDAWTPPLDPADRRSVEEQINGRPSIVTPARRSVFETPPKNVLVLRTDQLGDVVVSVPALRRLRQIFSEARLVGLFTSANADLARSLGILDEVIVIDFPDDKDVQRKRVMTRENQEALRSRLAEYRFDVALDLAPAQQSRPLLLLSGARFLAGMGGGNWPYLDAQFSFHSRDPVSTTDIMSASSRTLAFVESLATLVNSPAEIVRRPELTRERLVPLGIEADQSYVILHTGARIEFSRWRHHDDLAARLLERTDHKVVMLSENPETRGELPDTLLNDSRFLLLDRRLAFDDFDALLSHAQLFVGSDSGPKHLAALRGTDVVSLHSARVNWGEWGQEQTGSIIHRQVPCGGCLLYHDPEECGKDYVCMTRISPDEVWEAIQPYVGVGAKIR